jgi:hypothetical protein
MEGRWWARSGAAAGIAFVVALVISILLSGGAPMPQKPTAEIVKWYISHRSNVLTAAMLGAVASILFFWFLAHVRHLLAGRSPVLDRLGGALVISGVATATIGAFNTLPQAALAVAVNRPGAPVDEGLVRTLADLNSLFIGPLTILLALFIASFGAALLLRGFGVRWAGWIALVSSVCALVGGIGAFYPAESGKMAGLSFLGFIGLALFLITILITSITMLTESLRSAPAP